MDDCGEAWRWYSALLLFYDMGGMYIRLFCILLHDALLKEEDLLLLYEVK